MKSARFLTLCAFALIGQHAVAADLTERTMPTEPSFGPGQLTVNDFEATAADFELGACYVLYNVGSQAYFGEGNAWGTQASVTKDTPLLVRFTLPEGKTLDDAALLFNDYSNAKNAWKFVFFDNVTQMYVDLGSQANYFWQVLPTDGNKTYRLQASLLNPQYNPTSCPGFVGLDVSSNQENTALSPFLDEGDGHYIDWQFFAVPEWTTYFKQKDAYDVAMKLKAQIELCEAAGLDVSAAVAVYNNLNATAEELNAAIEALKEALVSTITCGTAENPADATALITNPNFDDASYDGWLGTAPNMVGSGSHGPANVAEFWNRAFDTYQELSGLPDGVYALRAKTAFRGSMEDMENGRESAAKLYAQVYNTEEFLIPFNNIWSCLNTESLGGDTYFGTTAYENSQGGYYSPNDPSAFRLYEEKGFYDTVLFFEMNGGKVRIGVKNPSMCPDGCDNWALFDTFTFKYYGKETAAYQKWVEQSIPSYTIPEDAIYTWTYADAYQESLTSKATNKAEALAIIEEVKARKADLQKNIVWWHYYIDICSSLADRVNRCKTYHESFWEEIDVRRVAEYLEDTYQNNLYERKLTTEQLIEEVNKVSQLEGLFEVANMDYLTSIKEFDIQIEPSPIYDLQGRQLNGKPQRGVYIENGHKKAVK